MTRRPAGGGIDRTATLESEHRNLNPPLPTQPPSVSFIHEATRGRTVLSPLLRGGRWRAWRGPRAPRRGAVGTPRATQRARPPKAGNNFPAPGKKVPRHQASSPRSALFGSNKPVNRVRSAVFRSEKRPSAGRSTVCGNHKQENTSSSPVCGSKKCHIRPRSPVWRSRQGPSEARSPVFCSGKVSSAPCSPVWRTAPQGRATSCAAQTPARTSAARF